MSRRYSFFKISFSKIKRALIFCSAFLVLLFYQNCAQNDSWTIENNKVAVMAPKSCLFNGQTLSEGQTITTYQNSSVPYGQSCLSQVETCTNGVLSGSYTFPSCSVNPPASCTFNGQTIAHGQTVTASQASTVPYGQSCSSENRTCNNGTLSGTYAFSSCTPGAPASCLFNGVTIPSGQTVTASQASTVPYGHSCSSEVRTCTNGTLSGTFAFSSCSVTPPASCTFNGQTIPHGQTITAYQAPAATMTQACVSQVETCTNGSFNGNYAYASCASCTVSNVSTMAKILFLVDTSGSNTSTDPSNTYRLGSINTFFNTYKSKNNFYWGLISFGDTDVDYVSQAGSASTFTSSSTVMQNAITSFSAGTIAFGLTPYLSAMQDAQRAITNDPDNTSGNRASGLKYYVVLMSDGVPSDFTPAGAISYTTTSANYTPYVNALLGAAPGAVTLDTVLYGNQNASTVPVNMLSGIASDGHGVFTDSTNLSTININNLMQKTVCP